MPSLIINRPDMQTIRQRYGNGLLTFMFWMIWFYFWLPLINIFLVYLWLPLISIGGWLMGVNLFYEELIVQEGLEALLDLLGWYLLVIFLISLTLGVWALVQRIRFRGKDRRGQHQTVDVVSLAGAFGVTTEQLGKWRDSKRLVISSDSIALGVS